MEEEITTTDAEIDLSGTPTDVEVILPGESQEATETDEEEFARLTKEKAWVNKDKKDRYKELKEKFTKTKKVSEKNESSENDGVVLFLKHVKHNGKQYVAGEKYSSSDFSEAEFREKGYIQ